MPESLQNRDELLAKHRAKYPQVGLPAPSLGSGTHPDNEVDISPQENSPIHDTAATLWLTPRVASGAAIHPIGHIALDLRPEEDQRMGLPGSGVVWIATLYVSWALQRAGMGGEAMKATERLAAQPPLNGTVAVLDVVPTEFHLRDDVVEKVYLSQGNPKPVVCFVLFFIPSSLPPFPPSPLSSRYRSRFVRCSARLQSYHSADMKERGDPVSLFRSPTKSGTNAGATRSLDEKLRTPTCGRIPRLAGSTLCPCCTLRKDWREREEGNSSR